MKAGHPCRVCGETVTQENITKRRAAKAERIRAAHKKRQEERRVHASRQHDYDHIVQLHHSGLSVRQIAKLLGSSTSPVQRALKAWKPLPNTLPKGKH